MNMTTDKELRERFIAWRNGPGTMAPLTEVADWWLNEFSLLAGKLIEALEKLEDDGIDSHTKAPHYLPFNKGFVAGWNNALEKAKFLVKERMGVDN